MRRTIGTAVVAVGLLALAACGDDYDSSGNGSAATSSARSESPSVSASGAVLATADSDFGQIVVDGQGMTAYVFDKDTADSGTSACSGQCLDIWPAITADSDQPAVDGVDGTVGTITRDDGTRQVTLDGMPLYTYAPDEKAGDVKGEGVQGVWWVVGPDGAKITEAPASSSQAAVPPGY